MLQRTSDAVGHDLRRFHVEVVAERIRRALEHVLPRQVILAPDCGMKYLPRDVAYAKLAALVDGAAQVRARLA